MKVGVLKILSRSVVLTDSEGVFESTLGAVDELAEEVLLSLEFSFKTGFSSITSGSARVS